MYNRCHMIRVTPVWTSEGGAGKEMKESFGNQRLFVRIDFIGAHYIPVEDIPSRVIGMEADEFAVVREPTSLDTVVFGLDTLPVLRGREKLIGGKRATTIDRVVAWPMVGGSYNFIDVKKFGENLAHYQGEIDGKNVRAKDVTGLKDFQKQVKIYKNLLGKSSTSSISA